MLTYPWQAEVQPRCRWAETAAYAYGPSPWPLECQVYSSFCLEALSVLDAGVADVDGEAEADGKPAVEDPPPQPEKGLTADSTPEQMEDAWSEDSRWQVCTIVDHRNVKSNAVLGELLCQGSFQRHLISCYGQS